MYCNQCGCKVDDFAKFCNQCGSPIEQNSKSKRVEEYGGKIIKCPKCGETLPSFEIKCPTCGYELRGASSVSAVKEFEEELKKIEATRVNDNSNSFGKAFARALGANTTNSVDQKLANRIANFSVPNTQEDIFEFMILAASNIDPIAYDTTNGGYAVTEREGKLLVSNAWDSKYNQVHQKAKMMFPNDPRLIEIEKLYKLKKKEIRSSKSKVIKILIGALIFLALDFGLIFGMGFREDKRIAELDAQLQQTVVEIQEDIAAGDYDNALIKANGLRFDKSLSSRKAEQWDEQREQLIEIIKEKQSK